MSYVRNLLPKSELGKLSDREKKINEWLDRCGCYTHEDISTRLNTIQSWAKADLTEEEIQDIFGDVNDKLAQKEKEKPTTGVF
jgi:hypothetical protein